MVPEAGSAEVLVPCTCGELVQGMLGGVPFLVSCPIDWYSRVRVSLGNSDRSPAAISPKAHRAAASTLALLGLEGLPFSLEVSCPLPPCKGFGSSTADVVGAISAVAEAAGQHLSPEGVGRLAVAVEPSDSTMFPGLALFDHRGGTRWEMLGSAPPLSVLVVDFDGVVDTVDYNANLDVGSLRSLEADHARALSLLRDGLKCSHWDMVGEAATLSARANQRLLPKRALEPLIGLGRDHGALGVCAAHSGTALGLLLDPGDGAGIDALLRSVLRRIEGVRDAWITKMVDGGARVVVPSRLETGIGTRCPSGENREAGANPARARHCEWGAIPRMATAERREGAGER